MRLAKSAKTFLKLISKIGKSLNPSHRVRYLQRLRISTLRFNYDIEQFVIHPFLAYDHDLLFWVESAALFMDDIKSVLAYFIMSIHHSYKLNNQCCENENQYRPEAHIAHGVLFDWVKEMRCAASLT